MTATLALLALSLTLEGWVAENAKEKVICQREANGEYFFVARDGDSDRLRLGSRIDLTGYRETLSTRVAWNFVDRAGRSLTAKVVPTTLRSEFLLVEGKAYAESVSYQTINVGASSAMRVHVSIEKCPVRPCSGKSGDGAARYRVEICETAL
jgi:hypothetical protein